MAHEVNFDGLIGPSHNYGGLSDGNLASAANAGDIANPREAALQGLGRLRPRLYARLAEGRGAVKTMAAGEASSRLIEDVDAIQTRFIRLSAPWALGAGLLVSAGMAALAHVASAVTLVVGAAVLVLGGGG